MIIKWLNTDPSFDLKEANLSTKRLRPVNPLTLEQWVKALRAEHSTLRFLSILVHDEDCPYTVASHIVRTTKEHTQPEMSSGRPDVTGKARDYDSPRWLHIKFTPLGLIRMMEDRLCSHAEQPTREWAERLRETMANHSDWMIRAMVPFCEATCKKDYRCREGWCSRGIKNENQ